jgi:pilus assembly protein Flp/PilA
MSEQGQQAMKNLFMKMYVWAQILREDKGQDLIEYALVVSLIAFAAIVGMNSVAEKIQLMFTQIATAIGEVPVPTGK